MRVDLDITGNHQLSGYQQNTFTRNLNSSTGSRYLNQIRTDHRDSFFYRTVSVLLQMLTMLRRKISFSKLVYL